MSAVYGLSLLWHTHVVFEWLNGLWFVYMDLLYISSEPLHSTLTISVVVSVIVIIVYLCAAELRESLNRQACFVWSSGTPSGLLSCEPCFITACVSVDIWGSQLQHVVTKAETFYKPARRDIRPCPTRELHMFCICVVLWIHQQQPLRNPLRGSKV